MKLQQQIPKENKGKRSKDWRWWSKRQQARGERRDAKRLGENAPKKRRFFGWD